MRWQAESVSDDRLAADFVAIDDNGKLVLVIRDSAVDAEPERMARQCMAALRMLDRPRGSRRKMAAVA